MDQRKQEMHCIYVKRTYLDVNILFARILNEESESILPNRAVGPVAGLQLHEEDIH